MRTNKPIPALVMERGHCKPICDASSREFNYPQESLPDAIEILLCLLDGAERRRRLLLGWRKVHHSVRPSRL